MSVSLEERCARWDAVYVSQSRRPLKERSSENAQNKLIRIASSKALLK
jgi:hypothetical protein